MSMAEIIVKIQLLQVTIARNVQIQLARFGLKVYSANIKEQVYAKLLSPLTDRPIYKKSYLRIPPTPTTSNESVMPRWWMWKPTPILLRSKPSAARTSKQVD